MQAESKIEGFASGGDTPLTLAQPAQANLGPGETSELSPKLKAGSVIHSS